MTDSKSKDHWNFLARQLGALPDTGPEEETEPPEATEAVEPSAEAADVMIVEPTAEPPAASAAADETAADETALVLEHATASVPLAPAKPPAPPRPPAPKPKASNHWRELAAALGIEISEPEPEEPEVAEVAAPIDVPTPVAPPELPAPVMRPPEPMKREFDAGSRGRPDSRREHRRPSLFDDPDLSLDTPGVLDAVFDEIEPAATAAPEEIAARRQPEPFADEFESRGRFAPKRLDDLFPDMAGDEEAEEAVAERFESGEALETEDEEKQSRRPRRRPRRRRRGGRRDQEPAEERVRETAEEPEEDEFEEEPVAEPRAGAAPVRDSRAAAERDEDEELEDEDHFDNDEEEEDGGERLKLKHGKIPTWQQAVEAIIAVNMESRAKNPSGGGGGRGRGRRWRK